VAKGGKGRKGGILRKVEPKNQPQSPRQEILSIATRHSFNLLFTLINEGIAVEQYDGKCFSTVADYCPCGFLIWGFYVWKKEMTMEKQLVDKEPEFYIQQLTTLRRLYSSMRKRWR
jgi:hypothetical protein